MGSWGGYVGLRETKVLTSDARVHAGVSEWRSSVGMWCVDDSGVSRAAYRSKKLLEVVCVLALGGHASNVRKVEEVGRRVVKVERALLSQLEVVLLHE